MLAPDKLSVAPFRERWRWAVDCCVPVVHVDACEGSEVWNYVKEDKAKFNASVPVPRLQLVQFDKAYNVSAGESRAVELVVAAETVFSAERTRIDTELFCL